LHIKPQPPNLAPTRTVHSVLSILWAEMSKVKVTGKSQITFVLQRLHWYSLGYRILARVRAGCCWTGGTGSEMTLMWDVTLRTDQSG